MVLNNEDPMYPMVLPAGEVGLERKSAPSLATGASLGRSTGRKEDLQDIRMYWDSLSPSEGLWTREMEEWQGLQEAKWFPALAQVPSASCHLYSLPLKPSHYFLF